MSVSDRYCFGFQQLNAMHLDRLVPAETEWLKRYLLEGSTGIEGQGLDLVLGHNDVQENNILQTEYGLRLIDFEYTAFNYQGRSIAVFRFQNSKSKSKIQNGPC